MENKKIIVSLTSWPKRINNVERVVFSLLSNTIKPDMIICNLAEEEFPNKTLPETLRLIEHETCFEINWVKTNTYTFKKFIPTLKRFYPLDYYLFTVDDDELYSKKYIETGVSILQNHKAAVIAQRNKNSTGIWGGMFCCQSNIFKEDYWKNITQELINERMNDPYTNAYLKFYNIQIYNHVEKLTQKYNDVCANRGANGVYSKEKIDKVNNIVNEIFRKSFAKN